MRRTVPQTRTTTAAGCILVVIGIAQLMVVLDVTIVNIALPSAQRDLGFSDDDRQWVITAYALAFGSLLLLGGRIADLFGRKWTFIAGLLGFAGASAARRRRAELRACSSPPARCRASFAAMLAPAALSLLTTTFTDPAERGKAFGIYAAIAGMGGAIGLLLGGALTELLDWRWCLYVSIVFAVPAAIAAHPPAAPRPRVRTGRGSTSPGALTASRGLFALVFGLSRAETDGWGDPVTVGFLVAQRRAARRRSSRSSGASPTRCCRCASSPTATAAARSSRSRPRAPGIFGLFLFLTFYLQNTKGLSALRDRPRVPADELLDRPDGRRSSARGAPRTGPRPLVPAGMLLAAARHGAAHAHRRRHRVRVARPARR